MKKRIIISAYLKNDKNKYGKLFGLDVYKSLYKIDELEIIEIKKSHKNNVWCRDYMPIKRTDGQLVQFRYSPGYMTASEKWKKCLAVARDIHKELKIRAIPSNIIMDGGAIEVLGDQAIVSDRVLRDNSPKNKYEVLAEIKDKLKLDRLIVAPEYPYDFTGHIDGIVRFIDSDTVLINDDPLPEKKRKPKNFYKGKLLEQWHYSFQMVFANVGLKVKTIPMTQFIDGRGKEHLGLYINFLKLDDLIIMPSFERKQDDLAAEKLEDFFKKKVIKVNSKKLAPEGGLINCVTWNA
ncbi:putative agmatine deiminase [subsurface metagenome]